MCSPGGSCIVMGDPWSPESPGLPQLEVNNRYRVGSLGGFACCTRRPQAQGALPAEQTFNSVIGNPKIIRNQMHVQRVDYAFSALERRGLVPTRAQVRERAWMCDGEGVACFGRGDRPCRPCALEPCWAFFAALSVIGNWRSENRIKKYSGCR